MGGVHDVGCARDQCSVSLPPLTWLESSIIARRVIGIRYPLTQQMHTDEATLAIRRLHEAMDEQDRWAAEGTIVCGRELYEPRPLPRRSASSSSDCDAHLGSGYGADRRGQAV